MKHRQFRIVSSKEDTVCTMARFWAAVGAPLVTDTLYVRVPCWLDDLHSDVIEDGDQEGDDWLDKFNATHEPMFTAICQQIKLHGPESFEAAYRLGGGIAVMSYLEELERGGS